MEKKSVSSNFFSTKARKRVTRGDVRYLKGDLKAVKRPVLLTGGGGPECGLIYSASPRGHRDSSLNAETRKRSREPGSHGSAARRPFLRTEARKQWERKYGNGGRGKTTSLIARDTKQARGKGRGEERWTDGVENKL